MNNSDLAYKNMLQEKLKKINGQINDLEKRNTGLRALVDKTSITIERLKLQAKDLNEQIANFTAKAELNAVESVVVDTFDALSAKQNESSQKAEDKIKELEALKAKLKTTRAKRKIERKIEHQQKIIKGLQKGNNIVSGIQKIVIYPKYHREITRNKLLNQQQAKANYSKDRYDDIQQMRSMLNQDKTIDRIKDAIYEFKGNRYLKKQKRAEEVLAQMKKSKHPIVMRGAKAVVVSKKIKDKINNKIEISKMQQIQSAPQVAAATATR